MKFRSGMIFALGASLVLAGCAGAAAVGGPVTSPTGKVYEPGTRPSESRFTAPAKLFLAQGAYDRALEQAQQGIAADSANPQHYFLAGQAYVGLDQYENAMEMFNRAEEIYPAYELEIEPVREEAWGKAFNAGVEAYNEQDMEGAIAAWNRANLIYNVRPEAYLNLAVVQTQQSNFDAAIEAYRGGLAALERKPATRELSEAEVADRAESLATMRENLAQLLNHTEQYAEAEKLFREQLAEDPDNVELQSSLAVALAKQGRTDEAQAIYNSLLQNPNLSANELFNVGVALFQGESYAQAAEAFRRVTEQQPNSRDAWYNLANALYAQDKFKELVPAAERLVELDPLNENSALILARAYRETQQNQKALQTLQRNEAAPVHVEALEFRPGDNRTTVRGVMVGNKATAGTPVQLRFTFYGPAGELGTQTVSVNAPAADETARFEVVLEGQVASGYKYSLVR